MPLPQVVVVVALVVPVRQVVVPMAALEDLDFRILYQVQQLSMQVAVVVELIETLDPGAVAALAAVVQVMVMVVDNSSHLEWQTLEVVVVGPLVATEPAVREL
jgi:hypothetical protein